jgi:endogenous inhibitor of DNA gyrase (YacG/DUF329 family)
VYDPATPDKIEDRVAPDNIAIEWAQFPVNCPKCGIAVPTTVGDRRPSIRCPQCGEAIDLKSPEADRARQAAAKRAVDQAVRDAGG